MFSALTGTCPPCGCAIVPVEAGLLYEIRRRNLKPVFIFAKDQADALVLYLSQYLKEDVQ